MPLFEVREWYEKNKGVSVRTFQWYGQEGFIPLPSYEGREGYYSLEDFRIVMDTMYIISWIKTSSKVKVTRLRRVLLKYKDSRRKILDALLNLIEQFPIYYWDDLKAEDFYDPVCDAIWLAIFNKLEEGVDLNALRMSDIADEVRNKIGE